MEKKVVGRVHHAEEDDDDEESHTFKGVGGTGEVVEQKRGCCDRWTCCFRCFVAVMLFVQLAAVMHFESAFLTFTQESAANMKLVGKDVVSLQTQVQGEHATLEALGKSGQATTAAPGKHRAPDSFLKFPPGTTGLRINIGPNYQPMVSCSEGGPMVCLLFDIQNAVAAELRERFKDSKNTFVFQCGVSNFVGLQTFRIMGGSHTGSSSLSDPTYESSWNSGDQGTDWVPVMTLANILDSLDPALLIEELALDMQGHDFGAVVSAGDGIKRVKSITAEAWKGLKSYKGVHNDIEADWKPYMAKMGFSLTSESAGWQEPFSEGVGSAEYDVHWQNDNPQ